MVDDNVIRNLLAPVLRYHTDDFCHASGDGNVISV